MDVAVILTYRCNARCSMCHIWQNPTHPQDEVTQETMDKIPSGVDYLNLTGGEPTLRSDLLEIVDLLYPKAMTLEISTNGLLADRLEPVIKKYPDVKIRISLEGFGATNNRIRGEKDGFERKVRGLLRLQELGGTDLGFATTIQDGNAAEVVDLFKFANERGLELATSTLHNGFQFHKSDNVPYARLEVAKYIEELVVEMLRTNSVKNWFRAYLNLGLIAKVLGHDRLLRCTAATDFVFIDPWSDVYACNVRTDLKMGNLERQSWDEVYQGRVAEEIREQVYHCTQNCWMVGSAKTAMRLPRFAKLPKPGPAMWVLKNKVRVTLGKGVDCGGMVDYSRVYQDSSVPQRETFLDGGVKRQLQRTDDPHYERFGEFCNR